MFPSRLPIRPALIGLLARSTPRLRCAVAPFYALVTHATTTTTTTTTTSSSIIRSTRFLSHSHQPRLNQTPQQDFKDDARQRISNAKSKPPFLSRVARRFAFIGRMRKSKQIVLATMLTSLGFYFYNSDTVAVTGRKRYNIIPQPLCIWAFSWIPNFAIEDIKEDGGSLLSDLDARVITVKRVLRRLMPLSGMGHLDWEIFIFENDAPDYPIYEVSVTPGGKVFIHTGMLSLCENEDAIATLLGHEIAHTIAMHTTEKLSAFFMGHLTAGSLSFLACGLPGLAIYSYFAYIGTLEVLFFLPRSRIRESEADYMGLLLMARACYDPREAVKFWQRAHPIFMEISEEPPEKWRSHPPLEDRIAKLNEWMPEAMKKRAESECNDTILFADRFWTSMRSGSINVPG
ncbi:peptidase family M48-domain-containing protein [Mariannaea sp. PMI_226]|nr:peptidase family M48-domain-containing protein [Mariannaea sp. PMI_226]